jgi:hypothetical protein
MNIASLNLGFNVMANLILGSEAIFVEKCQSIYPKNLGWANSLKELSMCSKNSAKFLSGYDIFGLQEVNKTYQDVFQKTIQNYNTKKKFKFISSSYFKNGAIVIGYDENIFGEGFSVTNNMKLEYGKDIRAIQAVWFPKKSLLFINLHAPHNAKLKSLIEKACNKIDQTLIKNKIKPDRIIITGDFNDHKGTLLNEVIEAFQKRMRLPNQKVPKTCCADNGYKLVGDYIFDSSREFIYFGTPKNYERKLSDHDPIVLTVPYF